MSNPTIASWKDAKEMVAHIPEIVWNPAFVGMVLGLGPLVPILTFGIRAERRDLRFSEQLDSESLLLVA